MPKHKYKRFAVGEFIKAAKEKVSVLSEINSTANHSPFRMKGMV